MIPASNVEGSAVWHWTIHDMGLQRGRFRSGYGPSVIWGIIVEGSGVWHRTIHDIGLQRGRFGLEGWDHP